MFHSSVYVKHIVGLYICIYIYIMTDDIHIYIYIHYVSHLSSTLLKLGKWGSSVRSQDLWGFAGFWCLGFSGLSSFSGCLGDVSLHRGLGGFAGLQTFRGIAGFRV